MDNSDRLLSQHPLAMAYEANRQVQKAVELLEHVVAVQARPPKFSTYRIPMIRGSGSPPYSE